jgi:hypothetical protein
METQLFNIIIYLAIAFYINVGGFSCDIADYRQH